MMSDREKAAHVSVYLDTIKTTVAQGVLKRLLRDVSGPVAHAQGLDPRQMAETLDEAKIRILVQLSERRLLQSQYQDLLVALSRYENGDEAGRSLWRRTCHKLKLDTKPAGLTKDMKDYNQRRHALRRGVGKPMYALREILALMEPIKGKEGDMSPDRCQILVGEIISLCERGLQKDDE